MSDNDEMMVNAFIDTGDKAATYFIWSNEHNAWWGPGRSGYSPGLLGAGEYTRDDALAICRDALPTAMHVGRIAEIPVLRNDLMAFLSGRMTPRSVWK